jgi:membrane-bound lytic murein transglycosylase D
MLLITAKRTIALANRQVNQLHGEMAMKRSLCPNALFPILMMLSLIVSCSGCSSIQSTSAPPTGSIPPAVSEPKAVQTAHSCPTVEVSPFIVPYYPPPRNMDLCGETVPLHIQEVAERFDREFTIVVYNHAQIYLWLKRTERYFPWLEEQLRYNNLPDDLKYVAVAESDLMPNACSSKGAAGPWQFMPATGCSYGLDQVGSMDKRYDFERATNSALRYLQDLQNRFKNWTLSVAAYNCGEGRVENEIRAQKTRDYYQLRLPQETERYVLRILAIKAVLNNPALYGYNMPKGQGYPEMKVDRTRVTLNASVPIQDAAAAAGTTFREMKRLNPALRSNEIPPGTHELKLPEGTAKTFEQNFPSAKTGSNSQEVVPAPKEQPVAKNAQASKSQSKAPGVKHHVVQKGDTLSTIARKYDVSVAELKKANKLKSDTLTQGKKLVIP